MADRPQLGDTPAGRALAKMPKPKKKVVPPPQKSAAQSVAKLMKDLATGGAYDKTMPPWQDNIRSK